MFYRHSVKNQNSHLQVSVSNSLSAEHSSVCGHLHSQSFSDHLCGHGQPPSGIPVCKKNRNQHLLISIQLKLQKCKSYHRDIRIHIV